MPDPNDGNNLWRVEYLVDDSVGTEDYLADIVTPDFRHGSSKQWKLLQRIDSRDEGAPQGFSGGRIVLGDEPDDVAQVLAGLERPDYFESHDASCRFTSS